MITDDQALARFGAVVIIEVLAFAVYLAPVLCHKARFVGWRRDCLYLGFATVGLVLLVGVLTFASVHLVPGGNHTSGSLIASVTELLIGLIYSINMIGLALVVARTGGPIVSLYAPWISVQLTGILLLELHKEGIAKQRSSAPLFFLLIALVAWFSAHWGRKWLSAMTTWYADPPDCNLQEQQERGSVFFTAAGMVLAFLGYWLPGLPAFGNWVKTTGLGQP